MEKRSFNPEKFKLNLKHLPPIDPSSISPVPKVKNEKYKPNTRPSGPKAKARPKEEIKVAEFDDASRKMDSMERDFCVPQNLTVGDASFCSTKYIDPNSTSKLGAKSNETRPRNEICQTDKRKEGTDLDWPNDLMGSTHEQFYFRNILWYSKYLVKIKVQYKWPFPEQNCILETAKSLVISELPRDAPIKGSAKSQLHDVCAAYNWKSPLFECCKEEGPDHLKLFTYKVTFVIESSNTILECFGAPQYKKKTAAEHAAEGALWYLKVLGYFPIKK